MIPTDTTGNFSPLVSHVNVNTLKNFLFSGLNCRLLNLLVQLLTTSYNVSSLELRNEKTATQPWIHRVANDILLHRVRVYHERGYADNVVSKFWFVRSFSSQHYSQFITNITSENVSQFRTKKSKTGSFICKVSLYFFVLRHALTVVRLSLWFCFSWLIVFIASTRSIMER